ncbi:hypothetical protein [Pedobacter sp. GR22-6]|uniref:hypothetical protein n=1 Tax=Pedobacter sp. GR22-6 TaxID=3127957 RepID=UPI00307D4D6C
MFLKKSFLLCTLSVLTLILSCKKSNQPDQLPEVSTEGKNTFGCVIDGKVFVPKVRFNIALSLSAYYAGVPIPELSITAPRNESERSWITLYFQSQGILLSEGVTYRLGSPGTTGVVYAKYVHTADLERMSYDSSSELNGQLHILKLTSKIISGTFTYDAISPEGKKVEVRNGRFDLSLN